MSQTLEVVVPREKDQSELPIVDPSDQLVADGNLQTLTVAEKGKIGGHVELDLNTLSPIQTANGGFNVDGESGDLVAVIDTGYAHFGIVDTKPGEGYRAGYYRDEHRFMLASVNKTAESPFAPYEVDAKIGSKEGMAAYIGEPDTATRIGREIHSPILETMGIKPVLATDAKISRNHASFWLDEKGRLVVEDKKSLNGTKLVVRPKETLSFEVDTEGARNVEDNEIVREAGNKGNEIDEQYRHNQQVVRSYLLDQFTSGNLYKGSNFTDSIRQAHRLAAAGDVYRRVGRQDKDNRYDAESPGRLRTWEATSSRVVQARRATAIAARYHDDYAYFFVTQPEGGNASVKHTVNLEGIDLDNLPVEVLTYGEDKNKYEYDYAPPEAIPQYLQRITLLGKEFSDEISKTQPNIDRALDLIARQYQYASIARPFDQINNSLFMNLANMQVKLLGLRGVTHQEMDIVAQRLQPDNFSRYFTDQVVSQQ